MTDTSPLASHKQKVRAVLESIQTGDPQPFAYIHPTGYIQHNLQLPDGLQGIASVVGAVPVGTLKARVVRVFGDGDHVFTHSEYDFFGPRVGFDVFRFDAQGLIAEHWDNLIPVLPPNRSGRTQLDGPTEAGDARHTESTRRIARDFVEQNWLRGEDTYERFIRDDRYLQHNPQGGDGLQFFRDTLLSLQRRGITMRFTHVHKVLAEGNFALVMSEGLFGPDGGVPTAFYDLFRVEDGAIVEHWDVIEPITPVAERRNANGKF